MGVSNSLFLPNLIDGASCGFCACCKACGPIPPTLRVIGKATATEIAAPCQVIVRASARIGVSRSNNENELSPSEHYLDCRQSQLHRKRRNLNVSVDVWCCYVGAGHCQAHVLYFDRGLKLGGFSAAASPHETALQATKQTISPRPSAL